MKAQGIAHAHGAHGGHRLSARRLLARVKESLWTDAKDVVLRKDLSGETGAAKNRVRLVPADRENVLELCRQNADLARSRARCVSYLANGYHGLLVEVDGRLVGHIWWCDPRADPKHLHPHLVRYRLSLEPGEVWGFDLYLMPEFRGGGMSNDVFALFRRHLRDAGYARVYGSVEASNLPAAWLHKVQGYEAVKTVPGTRLLRIFLWSDRRLFLRNPSFLVRQKFDYRRIL